MHTKAVQKSFSKDHFARALGDRKHIRMSRGKQDTLLLQQKTTLKSQPERAPVKPTIAQFIFQTTPQAIKLLFYTHMHRILARIDALPVFKDHAIKLVYGGGMGHMVTLE